MCSSDLKPRAFAALLRRTTCLSSAGVRTLTFAVLKRLSNGDFHSGEALARDLDVSRASIWNALNEAAQNASVRAVVLAAQGRAFCVGQDLSCPSVAPEPGQTKDLGAVIERHYAPLVRRLQSMPVPTVV